MLVFGHTHKPWVHEYGGVLFVNCGSVGKPKDGDPRGAFAVLTPAAEQRERELSSGSSTTPRRSPPRSARPGLPGEFADKLVVGRMTDTPPLARRLLAELLGSAFLAALVIGSGIAAQTLSPGRRGPAAVRERGRHRGRAVHDHPHVRPRLRRTLQPGRLARRRERSAASAGATRSPTSPPRSPAASSARSSPTACSRWPPSASPRTTAPRPRTCSPR